MTLAYLTDAVEPAVQRLLEAVIQAFAQGLFGESDGGRTLRQKPVDVIVHACGQLCSRHNFADQPDTFSLNGGNRFTEQDKLRSAVKTNSARKVCGSDRHGPDTVGRRATADRVDRAAATGRPARRLRPRSRAAAG